MTLTPFSFIQVIQLSQGGQGNNTNVISVFMLNHGVNDVGIEKRSISRISFLGSIYKISFKKMIKESIKSRLYCVGPKFSERHRIYALLPLMSLDLCPHALPSLICAISPRQCWISQHPAALVCRSIETVACRQRSASRTLDDIELCRLEELLLAKRAPAPALATAERAVEDNNVFFLPEKENNKVEDK